MISLFKSQSAKINFIDALNTVVKSIIAGLLIGLACIVSCQYSHPEVIFPVGLICIVHSNSLLYTGCIGHYSLKDYRLLVVLLGNLLGVIASLYYLRFLNIELLYPILEYKYNESFVQCFISSVLCGMLMCSATSLNKDKNILVIIVCVSAFVIGKFDHSIANMFYLGADGYSLRDSLFLATAVVGNGVGAKLLYSSYNMMSSQRK